MLFRKRERFERTDVPTPGPYTNVLGVAVVVIVFAALFIVFSNVTDRVAKETRLDDRDLSEQIGDQSSMVVTDENYSISRDTYTKILFLTVADASDPNKGTTLSAAQALMIRDREVETQNEDGTTGTATETTAWLVNLPLDAKVSSGETNATLADFCASRGVAASVVPLSTAANIKFSHVVMSTENMYDQLGSLAGADPDQLFETSLDLIEKMRTDMTATELVNLATKVTAIGAESVIPYDAQLVAETTTLDDGTETQTGYQVIDRTALCVYVETLV